MAQITYKYGDIEYVVDYSGESGKVVVERNPFNIANERVASYITSDGTYYPGELISVPNSDMTFNAVMRDAGLVTVTDSNNVSHDISDMVLNVVSKTGKNQPFSYVVLTVSRQLFIEANIEMIQKVTEFQIDVFGITGKWIYERLEDNGSYYDITLVNKAYYLKNITLLSLLNFKIPTPHPPYDTAIILTNIGLASTITWDGDEGYFLITFDNRSLTVCIKRNTYTVDNVETTDYTLTRILECNPDVLFYFLAKYVAKYNTSDIIIQAGYYYTGILTSGSFNISDKYTMSEIEALKVGKTTIPANNNTFNKVSIRLDEFCWDILQSLAYLSNREIIFDDKAYFIPIQTSYTLVSGYTSFTTKQDYIGLYIEVDSLMTFVSPDNYNTLSITPGSTEAYEGETLSIDWEPPESPISHVKYISTLALCENDDQGSQYLTASQKVISEAYETTIAISDTSSSYVGQDIKYLAVDGTKKNDDDTNNSVRNTQAKIVALNALIRNYKPGDCIEYSVNETEMPVPDRTITSWDQFNTLQPSDTCFKFQTMLTDTIVAIETYYVKSGQKWFEYDTNNPLRETGYDVNACAAQITDAHNNITLSNVPLALKTIEYPACVTTYTWGNPQFMDEQSQFNDLTAISQDTVLDNTSDTGISSGDATKLVVGNQYVHQLRDDRKGFTGLIMEKNLDNNVYRLVGYDSGTIQAQFNSEGKIIAGENLVTLSDSGITIGASPTDSPTYISLNGDSSILITDDTTEPAVSIAAQGSFFKNDVTFSKSITVDEGITIGDQGSKLSSGSLAISLVDSDNQTQTFTSPTVVTSPAEGEAIAGTYSEHRFTTTFNNLTGGSSVTISPTITPSPSSSGESGNITWVANQNNIANILLGKSNGNVTFSYKTAKNPDKYPQINITNMNLKVNAETGSSATPTITPNTLLRTYPVISSSPYQVPSTTIISIPISWEASTEGALNESLQVTLGYTTRTFSYFGSGNPTIGNKSAIKYVSAVISLTATQSAGSTYVDIKLPNTFTLSTSGALTGTFVYSIESIQFLVRLPLSRVLSFSSMRVGTLGMSSAGNMFVSKYGVWGSSTVVDTSTTPPVIKANSISPMVNANYLETYTNDVTMVGKTTSYNILGLKRIIAVQEGQQPQGAFESGDIVLFYQ